MSKDDKKKKGGFWGRTFGLKSKEDKRAEAAALKAEQQALIDTKMAERMTAINAAALKAARDQDAQNLNTAEQIRLEALEKERAAEQALHDVEAAKRLAKEQAQQKKDAQKKAQEEKERREEKRLESEKQAREQQAIEAAEAERIAALKAQERKAETAEAERLKQEREQVEREASKRRDAERLETERLEKIRSDGEREQAKQDAAELAKRQKIEAQLIKEAQARQDLVDKEIEEARLAAEHAQKDAPAPDGFLTRISTGLKKSTSQMSDNLTSAFNKRKLDDEALEELEELLIAADFGVGPATRTAALLAQDKFDKHVTGLEIKIALADVIGETLTPLEKPLVLGTKKPQILLFVGVNGSGKTTTLGKIAKRYTDQGKKVLMCAGDTFRAAAVEQLKVWGERASAPVVSAKLGADAAGLVYDAIARAQDENFDVLMIDTAGRLQNRTELMDELAKIVRVIKKQDDSAPHHSILVLDATVGQNALLQTEAFQKTAGITGLIMTKLDGTAKGGVLVALADKFKLPIHYIGIGERIEDLENFSAPVFAAALSGIADAVVDEV